MDSPRTTVGQLLFESAPRINFARLVTDLDGALGSAAADNRRLSWDHEDVALLDLGASRIGLCYARDLRGRHGAAITVTVGYGPDAAGDARIAARRDTLARLLVERIAARFPGAEARWSETEEVASAELFDALNEALPPLDPSPGAGGADPFVQVRAAARAERLRPRRSRVNRAADPGEVARIMARLEATLAARRAGRPDPGPGGANEVPDLPPVGDAGLATVRGALYAGPEDFAPSPRLRLAAHAMDCTLLVVALPVGAAMMTYSLARGADLHLSARVMTLVGFGALALEGLRRAGVPLPFV